MAPLAHQCVGAARMPTLYWPHGGGPMPLLGEKNHTSLIAFLKGVHKSLPAVPKAILIATAHWEEDRVTVSTAKKPEMLYDYYGFPPESYEFKYPAPGSPEVAARAIELLKGKGIPCKTDDTRGYDHGTFVPLMLAFPQATIPVVQMSLVSSLDPKAHAEIGRALAPLRDEGVLIVGSGMSFHNMRAFQRAGFGAGGNPGVHKPSESHPREEHLIPLMVVAGAAGDSAGQANFSDIMMGAKVSGYVFGL